MNTFQTLRRGVQITGIGLHSGARVTANLLPRSTCGIVFVRRDSPNSPEIAASPKNISDTTHATTLRSGDVTISTPEHLMAALWMSGITHCRVEIDGPEIPILDGSARDWCALLAEAGSIEVEFTGTKNAASVNVEDTNLRISSTRNLVDSSEISSDAALSNSENRANFSSSDFRDESFDISSTRSEDEFGVKSTHESAINFEDSNLQNQNDLRATDKFSSDDESSNLEKHAEMRENPEDSTESGVSNTRNRVDSSGNFETLGENFMVSSTRSSRMQRPIFTLRAPVFLESGNASVLALPHDTLRVSTFADFERDYLAPQLFDGEISSQLFAQEIAAARTFTLEEWLEPLRSQGLIKGGSIENALVLGHETPSSPLRFFNELARHKVLDLLGDIALLFAPSGGILRAHFVALRAGHTSHRLWMNRCVEQNALVATISSSD